MNFKGKAVRLGPDDFARGLALMPGVEAAALRAIIEVETGGSGFDQKGRPSALFERHLFWAELGPGAKRDRAAAQRLAYPSWGELPYPRSSEGVYAEIAAAAAIDEDAALRSASWGLGQILGRECVEASYPTANALVLAFMDGEGAQLAGMIRLIKARHLDAALKDHRWADFARAYNGSGYRRNAYDTKLERAYRQWLASGTAAELRPPSGPPAPDPAVRAAQASLHALGFYDGAIDGIAGPVTQAALVSFQKTRPDLVADGILGPRTAAALTDAAKSAATPGDVAPKPSSKAATVNDGRSPMAGTDAAHSAGSAVAAGTAAGALAANADPAHWLLWALVAAVAAAAIIEILKRRRPAS